jgi:inner membrane protein
MPTVISHSIVAIVFRKLFYKRTRTKFWIFSIICAIIPDFDVFLYVYAIPYGNMFEHRGFLHSIIFVLFLAFIVVVAGFREIKHFSKEWWLFVVYFFIIGLSHIILDAMTSGGLGIGFFMPFDSARYFLPYKPIRVSPYRLLSFFESEWERILISELFWIWIPSVLILIIIWSVRKQKYLKTILSTKDFLNRIKG